QSAGTGPVPVLPTASVQQPAAQPPVPQGVVQSVPAAGATSAAAAQPTRRAPERSSRIGLAAVAQEGDIDLDSALRAMIERGASALHLTTGSQPMIRLDGGLQPLEGFPVLYGDALQRSIYAVINQRQRETFEQELELDFAYAVRGVS